ncbi:UDP-N-acetylglucosamine--N-acetylmuramyl-(pentapeptide) pyrophosphoryl-undecaprenol N-acetylglucosamine transferase [Candidatus Falkowbacteria bacterium]|jgi:UDP-N-acetylglucosamine--N-acetylmuramyl-(pentapeptide) pyrophosphoryl-undecaprenol N-acetylglucosamine transferase|nr:UDP-N-acetylglucosamine--N-acetylmuramyl-(pentapeptide) pyrophosphoryl-undecaprenol N-acetylglucosamine transferase [Candidatus Falkowbacteria bacterium]
MSEKKNNRKIMLAGGGTGGSVTPLLVVAEELLKEDKNLEIVFVGTKNGVERKMLANFSSQIKYLSLPSGKWRRYFSVHNILDIFKIFFAFLKSFSLLRQERPAIIVTAGSFVAVPLVWAAAFYKIPVLVHQQDIRPGLANKLMAPLARVITVTFEKSLVDYGPKAVLTGNPTKNFFASEDVIKIREKYNLKPDLPFVLVTGGGTGASVINDLVAEALPNLLSFCQIINLTGQGKHPEIAKKIKPELEQFIGSYQAIEFVESKEFINLLRAADLIVSRCGLSALTEIAFYAKPAILIPIPHSHQEDNADFFRDKKAAIVLDQEQLSAKSLSAEIKTVLENEKLRAELSDNISQSMKPAGAENITAIIWKIINYKNNEEAD